MKKFTRLVERTHDCRPGWSRGFSLIESLIAIVLVSFAVLGVAALQLATMRNSTEAGTMTQAVRLSTDFAERVRSSLTTQEAVEAYLTASATAGSQSDHNAIPCTPGNACTMSQLAARDVYEWKRALRTELPEGGGTLCRVAGDPFETITPDKPCSAATSNDPLVVKVWWRTRAADGKTLDVTSRGVQFKPQVAFVVSP